MEHGDRRAIEKSIKDLTTHISNTRYQIRIKREELKILETELKHYKEAQKWRKEML